jgi:hypothetical protein
MRKKTVVLIKSYGEKIKKLFLFLLFGFVLNISFSIDSSAKLGVQEPFAREYINLLINGQSKKYVPLLNSKIKNSTTINALKDYNKYLGSRSLVDVNLLHSWVRKTDTFGGDNKKSQKLYIYDYEYKFEDVYAVFKIKLLEEEEKVTVLGANWQLNQKSLSEMNRLSFEKAELKHYIFIGLVGLIPLFIVVTIIAEIRTKMPYKILWVLFSLLGVIKLSLNWSTGEISFQLLSIQLLGSGMVRSGPFPWTLFISLPLGALLFWSYNYNVLIPERLEKEKHKHEEK